jgi:hypothetical protein
VAFHPRPVLSPTGDSPLAAGEVRMEKVVYLGS